eukprot:2107043-Rhodomonas_salina.6
MKLRSRVSPTNTELSSGVHVLVIHNRHRLARSPLVQFMHAMLVPRIAAVQARFVSTCFASAGTNVLGCVSTGTLHGGRIGCVG